MNGLCVLVVDDERDTRESLQELLQMEFPGCRVVLAEDGETAMTALDRTRFDLVLVDYRIPFVNGLEVAKYASQTKRARCILVTGYADPTLASAAINDGILIGMIHKTASSAEIIAFLRTALQTEPRPRRPPQSEAP